MEKQIKEAFQKVMMPENCAGKIEKTMEQWKDCRAVRPVRRNRPLILAACLAAVMLLASCTGVTEKIVEKIMVMGDPAISGDRAHDREEDENTDETYSVQGGQILVNWDSEGECTIQHMGGPPNADVLWLEEKDGRIWFSTLKERIDITGRFSEEEPFIYSCEAADGAIVCYYVVGGTCGPEGDMLSELGWMEFYYFTEGDAWTTGNQRNVRFIDKEQGKGCWAAWYEAAEEQIGKT